MSAEPFPNSNPNWNFNYMDSMEPDEQPADRHGSDGLSEKQHGGDDDLFGELDEDIHDAYADAAHGEEEEEILDPTTSERRLYRDPFTRLQREIWRPGDDEGDQGTDYFDRIGLPLPLEHRWRLFQTDIGRISARNQPPRFVLLDDCAASQVLRSDIPKAKMVQHWPWDFGGGGRIRARRTHRGRPAIKDANAPGNAMYYSTTVGGRKDHYSFTGEPGYEPVVYHYERPKPKEDNPRKRKSEHPADYNPRAHGHNQFTPKDLLVKHGAPSFSKKEQQIRAPRINTFLRRDPSPPIPKDRSLYPGIVESARYSVQREAERREKEAAVAREEEGRRERAAIREEEEREAFRATHGTAPVFGAYGKLGSGYAGSFPIHCLHDLACIPDDSTSIDVPRDMNFAQRKALEQDSTLRTLNEVRDQDDIIRLALKLSRAQIKMGEQSRRISEQSRQIERLEDELAGL